MVNEPALLDTLLPQFGGPPVAIQTEFCLNARYRQAGCRLCLEACPTQAIRLGHFDPHITAGQMLPQLEADLCVHCGLCLHVCPTDVFSQPDPPEATLAQTLANLPDAPLALVCVPHPNPATTAAPVAAIVRHQRCLAALSLSQLIDLSHNGQRALWLDDTPCAECPLGRVQPLIAQTAQTTNRLLEAFGRRPVIHTHLSQPETLAAETQKVALIEGNQPKFTRRGLFGAMGQLAQQSAAKAAAANPAPPVTGPLPVSQRLPHHLPNSRKRLIQQLAQLGQPLDEPTASVGLPFANVKIDSSICSACGLCARFCPTEALRLVTDEARFGLSFQPALCLACDICAAACPEQAISFSRHLTPTLLVAAKPGWLVVGPLTACAGCGQPTALLSLKSEPKPYCYSCRQSGGPAAPLKDTAGLMADLLKRVPPDNITKIELWPPDHFDPG